MNSEIIIAVVGGIGTILSSVVSWMLAKRKYNLEVDSNEIENLKKALEFYEAIVQDNNKKLQHYINIAEANSAEVYRLKRIVHRLLNNSCLDSICVDRKFFTEEQIKDILEDTTFHINTNSNEINS